jgi:hypothetical protein
MIVPWGDQVDKNVELERAGVAMVEGELELESSSEDDLGVIKAPRVTV